MVWRLLGLQEGGRVVAVVCRVARGAAAAHFRAAAVRLPRVSAPKWTQL